MLIKYEKELCFLSRGVPENVYVKYYLNQYLLERTVHLAIILL